MESETLKGAALVGASLREVRERLGWKLPDVAASLRIREAYLDAIERGELDLLPGFAYQNGFVRSYAQVLGLDPEEILRRFHAEGLGLAPKEELRLLAPVPDHGVPSGAIVLIGVVVLLIGYGIWYHHSAHESRLAAAVPAVPAQLAPLALPPAKPTPPLPTVTANLPAPAVTAAIPAPALAPSLAQNPALPTTGQAILATSDTWVEVNDASGNILFSRLLHAGDSWPVPDEPGLTLTTGNAGGTEISTNGTAGPPLGAPSAVLHNYALTPPAPQITPTPGN
jgi:cytoskeleton protein RodZ